jgi:predicted AlkP superfamily pyrophosphatase or phosphodiesterase
VDARPAPCAGLPGPDAGTPAPDDAGLAPADPPDAAAAARPDAPADAAPAATAPAPKRRLVLVSIDGLRPDAIFRAPATNLVQLACKGAYSWQARTILPSITLPSHASMVSGHPPDVHQLLWNDLRPGFIGVPTFLTQVHARKGRVVLVVGKEKLLQLAPPDTYDVFVWATGGDDDVADKAIAEARAGFDAMFVHFPMVDLTGHGTTWMSPPYLRQVAATDAAFGRLLAALPPGTTVIVSADHGGHDYSHFLGTPEDVTIPWIIAGPGVKKGHALAAPISTMDTGATAAFVLGVKLRPDALGKLVHEAFE